MIMGGLWQKVGLKGAPVRLVAHAIAQVPYDGGWHVMDGDLDMIYLLRDNETLASDRHWRATTTWSSGRTRWAFCWPTAARGTSGRRRCSSAKTRSQGEPRMQGRHDHEHDSASGRGPGLALGALEAGQVHVGPQAARLPRQGLQRSVGIPAGLQPRGVEKGRDQGGEHRQPAPRAWPRRRARRVRSSGRCSSPYPFVGGHLEAEGSGARFAVSPDGKKWQDSRASNLDKFFATDGPPCYQYQLRCQLSGGASLKRLAVINDLQMALLALARNDRRREHLHLYRQVVRRAEGAASPTSGWSVPRASRPRPPDSGLSADAGEAEGTDFVFRWSAPQDTGGGQDRGLPLRALQPARYALAALDELRQAHLPDRGQGQAQYTLPDVGLLTPDKQYYWHVRAKNEKGVWGPWSKTWNFTPRGPNYPLDGDSGLRQGKGMGILKWKANTVGRKPVKYRVYGSDEKGFSVSDVPYKVNVGMSKELQPRFPANFIAETTATELAVMG